MSTLLSASTDVRCMRLSGHVQTPSLPRTPPRVNSNLLFNLLVKFLYNHCIYAFPFSFILSKNPNKQIFTSILFVPSQTLHPKLLSSNFFEE
ncbi:hypothetical protein EV1_010485 [Malus domestica]